MWADRLARSRVDLHRLLGLLAGAVSRALEVALTDYQCRIAVALLVDGVPIDVLAERLATTRGRSTRRCTWRVPGCVPI